MSRLLSIAAVIALLAVSATNPAEAQSAAGFYKGKTVTLLIGSGVAGGTDAWSRTLARHISTLLILEGKRLARACWRRRVAIRKRFRKKTGGLGSGEDGISPIPWVGDGEWVH